MKEVRIEFEQPYGAVRVSKISADNGAVLSGAAFELMNGAGTVLATQTTGADGTAETGWLQWGRYRVAETGVPEHYADGGFVTEIDCTEDGKTYTVEAENEPTKGWIRLVKTDRLTGNPIEGVAFDIYENDEYGNALVADMTTGKGRHGGFPCLCARAGTSCARGATAGYVMEGNRAGRDGAFGRNDAASRDESARHGEAQTL